MGFEPASTKVRLRQFAGFLSDAPATSNASRYRYLRHSLPVRVAHWINFIALTLLLMSGLQIFNAHPALYWGQSSYSGRPPVLAISSTQSASGHPVGTTTLFGHTFRTTGLLGISRNAQNEPTEQGFPSWMTLPGSRWLAMGRRWHFFFAWILVLNGLFYIIYSTVARHLTRDLAPTRSDWRSFGSSILDHLKFKHARGEEAKRYNILQKLAYLVVIFGLLPFTVLMGLALSPRLDALLPGWVDWFGGRQSARTLHFVAAWSLVLFFLVHVFEVIIAGFWNNVRSMLTGGYEITSQDVGSDATLPP